MSTVAPAPLERPKAATGNSRGNSNSGNGGNSKHRRAGQQNNSDSNNDGDLLKTIANRQAALLQPLVSLTMYIPSSSVGAVIGRRGQNIANIQKLASNAATTNQPVRVSIVGHQDGSGESTSIPYTYSELDWSSSAWTPVVIRGDPCAAFTAGARLEDICNDQVDEVVLDIPLSRNKHAAIVGKRGLTLAALSADSNVRIMVPNKDLRHDVIQLEGDLTNVKECLASILQIAGKSKPQRQAPATTEEATNTVASPSATAATATTGAPTVTATVPLTNNHVPSQTKIRTMSRKTDCTIKKKKGDGANHWQMVVTGSSQQQVQAAVAMLQRWNDDQTESAPQQQQQQPPKPARRGKKERKRGKGRGNNNNSNGGAGVSGGGGAGAASGGGGGGSSSS